MKLVSFVHEGTEKFGAVVDDSVVDLGSKLQCVTTLAALLADEGALDQARALVAEGKTDLKLADVQLLPVIPRPGKVICVGINYVEHAAEAGRKVGEYPVIFQRYAETLVAHGEPILRPKVSEQFDFEAELAVVIGKGGAHIDPADAMEHVAGYTGFNDASVRDWQFHTHQYGMGKIFRGTGALGPWILTADEVPEYRELEVTGRLNGELMQKGSLGELAFDIPALISYV